MQVGASVLVAIAAATAAAGWLALPAIVLAFLLTGIGLAGRPFVDEWLPRHTHQARQVDLSPRTVEAGAATRRRVAAVARGVHGAAAVAAVALCGSVFATYLLPEVAPVAAGGLVAGAAAADIAGVRLDTYWRRWIVGFLLVAVLVFVVTCLAIEPVRAPVSQQPVGVAGVLLAGTACVPVFSGIATGSRTRLRAGAGLAAALAVAAAALYQLGPVRLGLSATSLRDLLAAADAQELRPVLAVAVVLATVPAALASMARARHRLGRSDDGLRSRAASAVATGVAACALTVTLEPVQTLLVAAVPVLGAALLRAAGWIRRDGVRRVTGLGAAIVAVAMLAVLPPLTLLLGVSLVALSVVFGWFRGGLAG